MKLQHWNVLSDNLIDDLQCMCSARFCSISSSLLYSIRRVIFFFVWAVLVFVRRLYLTFLIPLNASTCIQPINTHGMCILCNSHRGKRIIIDKWLFAVAVVVVAAVEWFSGKIAINTCVEVEVGSLIFIQAFGWQIICLSINYHSHSVYWFSMFKVQNI